MWKSVESAIWLLHSTLLDFVQTLVFKHYSDRKQDIRHCLRYRFRGWVQFPIDNWFCKQFPTSTPFSQWNSPNPIVWLENYVSIDSHNGPLHCYLTRCYRLDFYDTCSFSSKWHDFSDGYCCHQEAVEMIYISCLHTYYLAEIYHRRRSVFWEYQTYTEQTTTTTGTPRNDLSIHSHSRHTNQIRVTADIQSDCTSGKRQ